MKPICSCICAWQAMSHQLRLSQTMDKPICLLYVPTSDIHHCSHGLAFTWTMDKPICLCSYIRHTPCPNGLAFNQHTRPSVVQTCDYHKPWTNLFAYSMFLHQTYTLSLWVSIQSAHKAKHCSDLSGVTSQISWLPGMNFTWNPLSMRKCNFLPCLADVCPQPGVICYQGDMVDVATSIQHLNAAWMLMGVIIRPEIWLHPPTTCIRHQRGHNAS